MRGECGASTSVVDEISYLSPQPEGRVHNIIGNYTQIRPVKKKLHSNTNKTILHVVLFTEGVVVYFL